MNPFTSWPTVLATVATPLSVDVRNSRPRPSPRGASAESHWLARSTAMAPVLELEVDRSRPPTNATELTDPGLLPSAECGGWLGWGADSVPLELDLGNGRLDCCC